MGPRAGAPKRALRRGRALPIGAFVAALFGAALLPAEPKEAPAAEWRVRGAGFFENRALKRQLEALFPEEKPYFGASDVEDAALILLSSLRSDGYLGASLTARLTLADGSERRFVWSRPMEVFLPREIEAKEAVFKADRGPRYHYESLELPESEILSAEDMEAFFYSEGTLLQSEEARFFTPERLRSGARNLELRLRGMGYAEARAETETTTVDPDSGAVEARLELEPGRRHFVAEVSLELEGDALETLPDFASFEGEPFSRFLAQDAVKLVRNAYFRSGYPDVAVQWRATRIGEDENRVWRRLELMVASGSRVRVTSAVVEGARRTRESEIRQRISLSEGDWLDPLLIEESRLALSRLGVFERVDTRQRSAEPGGREVVFRLEERAPWQLEGMVGWGSFERLRGGFQLRRLNLFGLAHRARLRGLVSTRSFLGDLRYQIPQFLGSSTSLTSQLFALEREGASFDLREIGVDVALSRHLSRLGLDAELAYSFQSIQERDSELDPALDAPRNPKAGSLLLRLGRDRRDNPLNPREGYRLFGRFEWASERFGGEVDYQRAELGYALHGRLAEGLFWHGALTHGVVGSLEDVNSRIPVGRRFFPGGESTVRGFEHQEASPRDEEGRFIGALSYLLLNAELEQLLTRNLSLVAFADAVGVTPTLEDYPFDETLLSLGLGLRYRSFMGPVRLEYGRNVEKRDGDDSGTIHFSIGFPF